MTSTPLPEHICHGGTWNNSTKQFECEHTDTLPEQGGFNERLNEVLERFRTCAKHEDDVHQAFADECVTKWQAVDAIRTLVLEEIIGRDDPYRKGLSNLAAVDNFVKAQRNQLRAEQRKKLERSKG